MHLFATPSRPALLALVLLGPACVVETQTLAEPIAEYQEELANTSSVLNFDSAAEWSTAGGQISFATCPSGGTGKCAQLSGFTSASMTSVRLATDAPVKSQVSIKLRIKGPIPASGTETLALRIDAPSKGVRDVLLG